MHDRRVAEGNPRLRELKDAPCPLCCQGQTEVAEGNPRLRELKVGVEAPLGGHCGVLVAEGNPRLRELKERELASYSSDSPLRRRRKSQIEGIESVLPKYWDAYEKHLSQKEIPD